MLILTRHYQEKVIIGDNNKFPYIDVTVLGIRGNQVKLGINAPKDIPVHRQEIYQKIQKSESE